MAEAMAKVGYDGWVTVLSQQITNYKHSYLFLAKKLYLADHAIC